MIDYPDDIFIDLVSECAIKPERGTPRSSGLDVFIPSDFKHQILKSGEDIKIDIGIVLDIPPCWDCSVYNKSGISSNLKLVKGAELIDSDYRGNVLIHLFNIGKEPILLSPKMKIAQLVFRPVWLGQPKFQKIENDTKRGKGGFGSTGN